jgi:hypothetical protein
MFIAIPSSKDREYYIPENDQMLNHQNSLILHVLLDTPFSMCEGGGGWVWEDDLLTQQYFPRQERDWKELAISRRTVYPSTNVKVSSYSYITGS